MNPSCIQKTKLAALRCLALLAALLCGLRGTATVVDNFDDNTKTDWKDFTFVPDFGLPKESNGQFRFELPPAGQAIFTASQKTSEVFTLQEGRTIEFRADIIEGGGKDSFAVLAFIPTANSPGTLGGYGLAKSTTDVLITKGISKYFVADDGEQANIKNENVTLVLTLSAAKGNVTITAKILDKANANAVLWQKTVVDTPAADVLAAGEDSPAAPYITSGYFTLYCYEDFDKGAPEDPYKIYYDNAQSIVTDSAVLDNFDDNTKSDWKDFTFVPNFGLPKESNGQFRFELPPAGQSIFTASQKTSRVFDLKEGERLEFRADVIEGGGKDSFAVLAFIPTANSPGTLAGYGLAKSTTDILITKGINKYLFNENPATPIKNENITLVLNLTALNGSVVIHAKILDKANKDELLWEKIVVDTPSADVMADGEDNPAAPYITSGYYTLYCYEDFAASAPEDPYKIYYDNAVVAAAPVAANVAPLIQDIAPAEFSNFLPASTKVSFKASDDKALSDDKISITLNGTKYTKANGLELSGAAAARTATLGGLAANVSYTATLTVEDSDGESTSRTFYFDTFLDNNPVIELEDYNYGGGSFIASPVPIVEGNGPAANSYSLQVGASGVDYQDSRTSPRPQDALYRPEDPVRMQHTLDNIRSKYTAAGGAAASVFDYDVGDITEGEWLQYTRTFPAGTYEVYLRQSIVNMASGDSVLELVTGDRTQANATTRVLGTFLGQRSGFQYRNFPLTDGTGKNKFILRLSGSATTLRFRQVTADTADGGRFQNYMILVPVADPGIQRAAITSLAPAPDAEVTTVTPSIRVEIQNRDSAVQANSIALTVNGSKVSPKVVSDGNGAVVTYDLSPLPPAGTVNTARVAFKDDTGTEVASDWKFTINYTSLNPANRRTGKGVDRGMNVRVVQAPAGTNLANDLQRAEDQLAPGSTIPVAYTSSVVQQVINQTQDDRSSGYFPDETMVPDLDTKGDGTDDFAVEINTWLELPAGVIRFGVVSDDGYKVSSGATTKDRDPIIAYHNGGPANETFDFVAPQPGLYPFRLIWYERAGNAYAEWFSVNIATGDKTLINDPNAPGAIKAYLNAEAGAAPVVQLESSETVTGPYAVETAATVDSAAGTIRLKASGAIRFFRLRGTGFTSPTAKLRITSGGRDGNDVLLKYAVEGQ